MSQLLEYRQQKDDYYRSHPQSPIPAQDRATFQGLPYFDPQPDLELTLEAELFDPQDVIQMQTTTGTLREYVRWGRLHFEVKGALVGLTLYYSPDHDHYFLPFMDATNGEDSYSGGRYIDPTVIGDNLFYVDFNLAYAPYCAYNPNYSCPIPPKENRLSLRIEAGEKLYIKS